MLWSSFHSLNIVTNRWVSIMSSSYSWVEKRTTEQLTVSNCRQCTCDPTLVKTSPNKPRSKTGYGNGVRSLLLNQWPPPIPPPSHTRKIHLCGLSLQSARLMPYSNFVDYARASDTALRQAAHLYERQVVYNVNF